MVVRKHPFDQQQASYYAYLRRWKASERMEGRVRFDDFLRYEQTLVENEFFMAGLRDKGTTRGGAMPRLIKQQKDLRVLMLIEEEDRHTTDVQGPTGKKPKDDDGMVQV